MHVLRADLRLGDEKRIGPDARTPGPTQFTQGGECCAAIRSWSDDGCWCNDAGRALLGAMPRGIATAALRGLSRLCGVGSIPSCS